MRAFNCPSIGRPTPSPTPSDPVSGLPPTPRPTWTRSTAPAPASTTTDTATPTPRRRRRRGPDAAIAVEPHEAPTTPAPSVNILWPPPTETIITDPTGEPRIVVAELEPSPMPLLLHDEGHGGEEGEEDGRGCCGALNRNRECLMFVCFLGAGVALGAMVFCYVMTWGLPKPGGGRMTIMGVGGRRG